MTNKVQKIREEVERLKSKLLRGACSSQIAMETMCKEEAYNEVLAILDTMQEEPVSEDLGDYINELSKQFPEVSFAKLSRIAVRVAKWQKEKEYTCYEEAFEDGAKWKVENLWKPADGDDLPEYEREVIVLVQDYHDDKDHLRVVFAHRPNKYTKVWNSDLGEEQVVEIERYDKGGWNIPNVKYWLDCSMPKEIEL